MPLLDSFKIDHTKLKAPCTRIAKKMKTPKGDEILVFDLRFCTPNQEIMDEKGIHTLEHLFAGFMREFLNSKTCEIIDISPMGCRTGFYMSVIGHPNLQDVATAWKNSMEKILQIKDQNEIPELNIYQCGSYKMHSLELAKKIAQKILQNEIKIVNSDEILLKEFE